MAKVDALATDKVLPALMPKLIAEHKRHWRSCTCDWCWTKERATAAIARVREPNRKLREEKREALRKHFRALLGTI